MDKPCLSRDSLWFPLRKPIPLWVTPACLVLETRDRKDSEALQNQKSLIREYIQGQKDLKMLSIFEDNGETGTNFAGVR